MEKEPPNPFSRGACSPVEKTTRPQDKDRTGCSGISRSRPGPRPSLPTGDVVTYDKKDILGLCPVSLSPCPVMGSHLNLNLITT